MTAKRDLKRRVRQRQARTGESYVTARRRVLAARGERSDEEHTQPGKARQPEPRGIDVLEDTAGSGDRAGETGTARAMPVVELHDVTEDAWKLGYRCRITVFPSVLEACELTAVLTALRDALVGEAGDPGRARMFDVAFGLRSRTPLAVLPEPFRGEAAMTFAVAGRGGSVAIRCRLWPMAPSLMLRRADETEHDLFEADPIALVALRARGAGTGAAARFAAELFHGAPALFVIYRGQRTKILGNNFVIGRGRNTSDLAIRDGLISRKHAAVIRRDGAYYMKDLGSTHGIVYKGMRIDSKRIDEGDVFHLADHALRFTFRPI